MSAKRILVVEDSDDLRGLFRSALQIAGFDVVEAADGLTALQLLEGCCPDLVVLDLRLPVISGFEVNKEIRQLKSPRIPVVVTTALCPEETVGLRANFVLRKPVILDQLVATVRTCLHSDVAHDRRRST